MRSIIRSRWKRIVRRKERPGQPPHFIKLGLFAITLFSCSMLLSFVVADRLAEDIWKRLGINRQEGSEKIRNSFVDGYLHYEGLSRVKNLALSDRTAVAGDLMSFAKQYLNSPVFKGEYDKVRKSAQPVQPQDHTVTREQIRQKQINDLKQGIANLEKVAKSLPADQQKGIQSSIDLYNKNIREYGDPNNKVIEAMYQRQLDDRKRDLDHYQADVGRWEKSYPADVRQFVKGRLQHYLDVAATVDFSAQLKEMSGKRRFINPAYQAKNNEWKMIYRAGKEVYEQAKPFAEQWIKELQ